MSGSSGGRDPVARLLLWMSMHDPTENLNWLKVLGPFFAVAILVGLLLRWLT